MNDVTLSGGEDAPALDLVVAPGRFQIFTEAHRANLLAAAARSEMVAVVIGSVNQARDTRNSFTFEERREMIRASLPRDILSRFIIIPQEDHGDNPAWVEDVQRSVYKLASDLGMVNPNIGILGHLKDHTSSYLSEFPRWDLIEMANTTGLNATSIRNELFFVGGTAYAEKWLKTIRDRVPEGTVAFLREFMRTQDYADLVIEAEINDKLGKSWYGDPNSDGPQFKAPYPVQLLTTDAVMTWGEWILLVKRGGYPGKGLWAHPGGFLNPTETFEQGAAREGFEETEIELVNEKDKEKRRIKTERILIEHIVGTKLHDDPMRSTRPLRTVSVSHHTKFDPKPKGQTAAERKASLLPPHVVGTDDAEVARWFTRYEYANMRSVMFEDHWLMGKYHFDKSGF